MGTICVLRLRIKFATIKSIIHLPDDDSQHDDLISNSYTMVCPPVRGDNPGASASGLSPVQGVNPWYNCMYFLTTLIIVRLAQYELFCAKFCDFRQGWNK